MTNVRLLRITVVAEPFEGFQMDAYGCAPNPTTQVSLSRGCARVLMILPASPTFYSRIRTVEAGPVELRAERLVGPGAHRRAST